LLTPIRAGDRVAFTAALERELNPLYRFVARELRYHEALGAINPGELLPEEIVDEVALRALRQARNAPRRATFKGWLRQFALRAIHEQVRRLRRQHQMEALSLEDPVLSGQRFGMWYQPDVALTWEDVLPAPVPTPEDVLVLHETQAKLEQALNTLPPDQRLAFILHAIEGLSYAEVAAIFHWPRSAVKAAYHTAREALRQRFAGRLQSDLALQHRAAELRAVEAAYSTMVNEILPPERREALLERLRCEPAALVSDEIIDETLEESFPASDPPFWMP
jgi:RNA polymerase sigma-70 factor (ECF subfamily)